jgi:branched-chain amino acid transport system substrate-binding protein
MHVASVTWRTYGAGILQHSEREVMDMGRRGTTMLAGVLGLTAVACGGGGSAGAKSKDGGGKTLTLAAALSLTGTQAREGVLTREGYEICQQVVNGKGGLKVGDTTYTLAITYQDDTSTPDTAANLVDQFNDKGRKFLLGPYGSASTSAAAAVVERNGQVMVDSAGADDTIFTKGYRRTFAVLSPASVYLSSIVKALAELADPKPKTVAIVSADDGFSKTAAAAGRDEVGRQGMTVADLQYVPNGTTDVSAALTRIRGGKPDVVLGSVHLAEGIAIVKQSGELGLRPSAFGETVAPPTPDFVTTLGAAAEGVLGSSQWTTETEGSDTWFGTAKDYAATFRARYGRDPEYHNAEASAACLALVEAIGKAGVLDADKVRDALAALDQASFFGPLRFDPTGKNATKPMAVVQIQSGKAVTVWPKSAGTAALRWPAR